MVRLAERLQNTGGKKVYGYLKRDVKNLVDRIVDELAKEEKVDALRYSTVASTEIEKMMVRLSERLQNTGGKKVYGYLKLSDGELRETQMTNYFSNLYPIDCAVLSVNAQSYRKYGTLPEHEFLPEI